MDKKLDFRAVNEWMELKKKKPKQTNKEEERGSPIIFGPNCSIMMGYIHTLSIPRIKPDDVHVNKKNVQICPHRQSLPINQLQG